MVPIIHFRVDVKKIDNCNFSIEAGFSKILTSIENMDLLYFKGLTYISYIYPFYLQRSPFFCFPFENMSPTRRIETELVSLLNGDQMPSVLIPLQLFSSLTERISPSGGHGNTYT